MKTITVCASKQYDVLIGTDLLAQIGMLTREVTAAKKAVIISDSNVWPIYGTSVREALSSAGFKCCKFVFPAGEASKNGLTYLEILNFLADNRLSRSDVLIALGGGVVGDITGFAAATYLRGVACVQVPTSLLSMVDSSVGGKTAIDLPAGKNLAGAFYQPNLVICDIDTLKSLPDEVFRDGCAEVIKYGILYDTQLFTHLADNGVSFDREYVISRCVALKRDVVANDEFDTGARQMLNLGHTVGHGIEACSNYTVSHGKAVAIGMSIIAKSACARGLCTEDLLQQTVDVLKKFDLPVTTSYSAQMLYDCALSDKKRSGGHVNLIIPRNIGNCAIMPTSVSDLQSIIEAGL